MRTSHEHAPRSLLSGLVIVLAIASTATAPRAAAHFFIFEYDRVGAVPPAEQGTGWRGECFFIPPANASSLLTAESYVLGRVPDFTFRTPYVDFPAGPLASDLDSSFDTVGDFLDDYLTAVSDPTKLNAPFGHLLLRFTGYLAVEFEHSMWDELGLPVRIDFATLAFDGFRTRFGSTTIYRVINTASVGGLGWYSCDGLPLALGLYPATITYFNRYDPTNANGNGTAGVELYSWYVGGLPWPGGEIATHPTLGPMTILPPEVVYQADQVVALLKGDFEADFDFDLADYQWLQTCHTGADNFDLGLGCSAHDFDLDGDCDDFDYTLFIDRLARPGMGGPLGDPFVQGDENGDLDIDFADLAAFQACINGPDGVLGLLTPECAFSFDFDGDADVDVDDFYALQVMVTGPRGRLFGGGDGR